MRFLYFLIKFLLLPALFANAWDIAVITKQDIEFFHNESALGVGHGYLKDLSVGVYDPVHGYLYVSDSTHSNTSIFRINTQSAKDIDPSAVTFEPVISKQASVQGIAFDPITNTLFWTTGKGNTILKYTVSEINTSKSSLQHPGKVVHSFDDGSIPRGITVDSCRKNIYWTNIKPLNATIERSNYDGLKRTLIAPTRGNANIKIFQPYGIVVDQNSGHLYWCDAFEDNSYQIVRSNLDGGEAEIIINHSGQEPYGLTIANDKLFWTDQSKRNLYSLPLNGNKAVGPKLIKKFGASVEPDGVISNTLYLNLKTDECPGMESIQMQIHELYQKESPILSPVGVEVNSISENCSSKVNRCFNKGEVIGGVCKCQKGYQGAYCEQSVCNNYCLQGSCEVQETGQPICKCNQGWNGTRCEINQCQDVYCLNNGHCVISENNAEPMCECVFGFSGRRCEFQSNVMEKLCEVYCKISINTARENYVDEETMLDFKNAIDSFSQKSLQACLCSDIKSSTVSDSYEMLSDDISTKNSERPVLMPKLNGHNNLILIFVLAMSCIFLGGLVVILTNKVLKLRKRPRIRKRIVVNRPSIPFCRPPASRDQCEITIENCCNMNVCETPCFEPEFRSSKPTFNKKKSEDKKGLITSMYSNSSLDDENQ